MVWIQQLLEAHNTTRINGVYVKTVPHITGDIVNMKAQTGYALHYNLNQTHMQALPDLPPTAPNPEKWELKFKDGKGFILVDDETETVRET
ncbi:hypothetical protein Moror_11756 [Moniliophthora roreri MCA 2997]|uniref:Uncharacterized protein n=1 Tax=Moniliophthora roreri (strain MCA 2997) TaxID=1381753 RepID=V2XUB0_MONRO|nr:hypothetical protein Moror_11756 [Moniliophthora roreri MCA 2997]